MTSIPTADIALIGLGVMGQNLALNMEGHGFTVAVYNRTASVVDEFIAGGARGKRIIPVLSLEELVGLLKRPRRVMLMVKAGQPVDDFIERLIHLLEPGDVLIDGGNSHYTDTMRRAACVEARGLFYVGLGVSGGEEGARHGPSLMPGGSPAAWPHVRPIFQAIAARAADGSLCCDWVGENGAGHFVKMVHNGIEYADMQIIAEAYHLMQEGLGLGNDEMSAVFGRWNEGRLRSYLIEITRDILAWRDETAAAIVDLILDSAGQKGTGKWAVATALDMGVPLTLIGEAVFCRFLSALKEERMTAFRVLQGPSCRRDDRAAFSQKDGTSSQRDGTLSQRDGTMLADLEDALYAARIVSYAQGHMLMRAAAARYGWNLNYGGIAQIWRGGCIIRSALLDRIKEAFDSEPQLVNLLLAPCFRDAVAAAQGGWRRVVATAIQLGIPTPVLSAALAFFDGYRRGRLPANLIQAQRDYFGAHAYERIDRPRGQFFHTNWTGKGGDVTAGTYQA